MNVKFSPSLMTMDLKNFKEEISFLSDKVDSFHIDIMDGHFVPNLTLSPWFIDQVRTVTNTPVSSHLMVEDPTFWVDELIKSRSDYICFPAERANGTAYRMINKIHAAGLKAGVVLNPETPVNSIASYLDDLDKVTIMTVDPGFAGEKFVESALDKIVQLRDIRDENQYHYLIEMDGSSNRKSFKRIHDANPDIYIIGRSGLFGLDDDIEVAWNQMVHNFYDATGVAVAQ
ncbi:D-allulose 6-phosphate 3-epimerase [Levilactobacillus namurensis]|uniref:D-allulose 6-phosphate 3-epimerase n=1 Tax=Levilactobacillus namurensis TaxID=380393 RepID=UPI002230E3B8|nr:D-allulose 6-phosphate 3-epimerase [Levilactobacillus namurensis]MCW3779221.1 D-allulose 6-phosphate 3-epimerase [Levilactobacillus namurensis]MDT7019964.1 D-allulose 6-phosphate 3-epimerase [Levilactobacillus namurensis]WNN65458.1 D-allulose 6-phosphate 3-epimerase [Levilactobacillus namurensis]